MELFWKNEVLRKRRHEQDFNEDKLLEAREKLLNVQLQLSLLIEKKQEKADEMVAKAQKYFFSSLFRDYSYFSVVHVFTKNEFRIFTNFFHQSDCFAESAKTGKKQMKW